MNRTRVLAWTASVVATVALAFFMPYRLTDGDSCLYAAMAHDMAAGGRWVAPQWDFHGEMSWFREHPPGAMWLAALVERCGAPYDRAALVANALSTLAALAGVVLLARTFVDEPRAHLAGVAFLLHVAVMKYVQRASLEMPFAATAAWTMAAGLRLARSPLWVLVAAVALTAAFLVRGVFALVPAALLVYAVIDRGTRLPVLRVAVVLGATAGALWYFDFVHRVATYGSFWANYLDRQVLPSLEPGGTSHSVTRETWTYYVGRALLYTLPWLFLPMARIVRGPRPLASPQAWRLAAAWIVLTVAGASMSSREGSRYLFQMYVASSLLVGLALAAPLRATPAWTLSVLVVLVAPCGIALKSALPGRDDWWRTAVALDAARGDPRLSRDEIRGPFQPEDDRMKSLIRFHVGAWVSSRPVTEMRGVQWVPKAGADFPAGEVILTTPLGALIDYGR